MLETVSPEQVLAEKGFFIKTIAGTSMRPLLLDRTDTVVIEPITAPLKKYDVVLYRRQKQLVLHRIIKVVPDFCFIRGDNCIETEKVHNAQIIGIMTKFCHKGKEYSANDRGYKFYSHLWVALHVVVAFYHRVKSFLYRAARKLKRDK